jgi:hypothetical protein
MEKDYGSDDNMEQLNEELDKVDLSEHVEPEPQPEPKPEPAPKPNGRKKRSQKQIEAFEKARKTRTANLKAKREKKLAEQHEAYLKQKSEQEDIDDKPIQEIKRKKKKKVIVVSESETESEEEVVYKKKRRPQQQAPSSPPTKEDYITFV